MAPVPRSCDARNRVYLSINLETLIASLLEKQPSLQLSSRFDRSEVKEESEELLRDITHWFPQARNHRLWSDAEQFHSVIRKGCWPLSPYSTWFLFHLAAGGKHLQERSALAMLGHLFERFHDTPVTDDLTWLLTPVDFWSDDLQHELISSEESGQQGAITHAYASVDARHGASLPDSPKRLLRAVVLASKLGLQATDREDATDALSKLAGLHLREAGESLRLLQDEYNVVEWDEAFKQFDILGDAVPRTQFLSFIRNRVASTYDEAGKAALFASKAATWCELLGDVECDFSEKNKITTREWRYQGVTSNLENFHMNMKLATDRWQDAIGVDQSRGTVIYCYVEPGRDSTSVVGDIRRLLKAAARTTPATALPILTVLLCDEDGSLGQALAEFAVLEEAVNADDRVKFGNLIPAHKEKLRQVVRSHIESMIKRRQYVTSLTDELEAQRLDRAGTELFSRIYKTPITFPFDGFSTARGNAADSCLELTTELLLGKLDYDAVMSKPVKVKNRAVTVLKDTWGIFAQNGAVRTRPEYPAVRALMTKWDDLLAKDERQIPIEHALRQLCSPPYGANMASAAMLLGVFIAPRINKLVIVRNGQQVAISQWIQDGIFRGKFVDLNGLHDVGLVMLGEESAEWDILLDEWEQAESYAIRANCFDRARELKARVPVPPSLAYRLVHFEEKAHEALKAIADMDQKQNEAMSKLEAGLNRDDVGLIAWGAATLRDLCTRMVNDKPLWDVHQIVEVEPHIIRARQEIIQSFPKWLPRQSPTSDTPVAVGDFKHKMVRLLGGNLKILELDPLVEELEKHVSKAVRNAESAAEARQLVRDVRSWLTSHADAHRIVRVADGSELLKVARDYSSKLQGMVQRIQMPELGEVRTQLAQFMAQLKETIEQTRKRAKHLWKVAIGSEEEMESHLEEIDFLVTAFENCPEDLSDLHRMRRALRTYHEIFKQLADHQPSWSEFQNLAQKLQKEAEGIIVGNDVPWPPNEVISSFFVTISARREEASTAWIDSIELDTVAVSSMSAADANRLHTRATSPPSVLTEPHTERLSKVLKRIENRLDELKIGWLVEKFKELAPPLRKAFLQLVERM